MKKFNIKDGKKPLTVFLPTSLNEITKEYLLDVTENVVIAPNHVVVACIYRCKLPEIISSSKKSKALSTKIVPIYVKSNLTEDSGNYKNLFDELECGNKIIIANTDLERGYHLATPRNFITVESIVGIYYVSDEFAKNVMADQNNYYFVDFKVVPVVDVKGFYKTDDSKYINPFVVEGIESAN